MLSTKKIKFFSKHFSLLEKPIPTKRNVPDWYKRMENFPKGKVKSGSVKKCIPFLDALTSGYYLVNNFEIYIGWKVSGKELDIRYNQNLKNGIAYELGTGVKDHIPWQVNNEFYNEEEIKHPLKFDNPWSIETPKGYSCMFLNPPNNPMPFRLIEGIVDTDNYKLPINLPFVLKNFETEVLIPVGQPLCWVMPFRRENWKMEIFDFENHTDDDMTRFFKSFLDNYRSIAWSKKSYD